MRVGRGDGSTDDADVCGLRTVCHRRPEVESMCVHVSIWLLERHVYTYAWSNKTHASHVTRSLHHASHLIKQTVTLMREGLSEWHVTIDPPVCEQSRETA
jgi:hypothetical protein